MSEISPVIATSGSTCVLVRSETKAVRIAVPALGPSLPIAPSGLQNASARQAQGGRNHEARGHSHV